MDREKSDSAKRLYLSGILSGIFICLIVLLLLQFFGVIPKWWSTGFVKDVTERARVVESYIDKYYWKDDVSKQKMSENAAKGMVSTLDDKYSAYFSEEEYQDTMHHVNGDYCGIGATLKLDSQTNRKYIESVEEGKPADRAGLQAGDEVVKVNGTDISPKTLSEVVSMIKGEEGKKSTLVIGRMENGVAVQKEVTVACEKIVKQSIESRMLESGIGYIRITEFDKETVEQYKSALDSLEDQGQQGLVLDVRDNGGGSLDACVAMLNRMLPEGTLITEKTKHGTNRKYLSNGKEHFDKPIVILINGNSASASEVFSGTMRDRGAATLIGVKSFGKGIVQTIFPLDDSCGGGIKLTTGEYLLPNGESIHKIGLEPDVEVVYTGTSKELGADDDNQLAKAVEVVSTLVTK